MGPARAADLEAFEFNDPNGTQLSNAQNFITSNMWTTSEVGGVPAMLPSDVRSGSYRVIKDFDGLAENWLQMDNVTSGRIYLVTRMSSWAFRQALPTDPNEEIRFGFLNDDTGTSGNTITAEMQIRRNTSGDIELFGRALGTGASVIANTAPLPIDQINPFTAVLEVDFDSDAYKVFYKDGSNPSQLLGQGAIAPTRAANSVRFAANNNFGSTNFFPTVIDEQFNIDRIAVSDTNPLTDLVNVVIDRDAASLTLINGTGVTLSNLESISIQSSAGSLNPAGWKPVAGNYDNSATGNGSVDNNGTWSIVTSTASELSEMSDGGDGGVLAAGSNVVLSMGDGAWLKSPFEDVTVTLGFAGNVSRAANVTFVGNGGQRFPLGDLTVDGALDVADWLELMFWGETDLQGLTRAQAYRRGDLNGDNENNIFDVGLFKDYFDAQNGPGSFDRMIASLPEPTSGWLVAAGLLFGSWSRRRWRGPASLLALVMIACLVPQGPSLQAGILEDFPFNDVNGATLGETDNVVNLNNRWTEETAEMVPSAVANPPGVFRIQKANDNFARNYLDIANITTGQAWLVAEIAGWSFSSLPGAPNFDPTQLEDIRFDFLNNDGNAIGGSTITASARIARNAAGGIELSGFALGSGTNIAATPLSLTQSQPFQVVVEINEDNDTYQVYFKDGGNPFVSIGAGNIDPARDANSIRFGVNNNFSGTGEFFDVDRLYLTDVSPIVDVVDPLTLKVNLSSGQTWIANDSTVPYTIDSYRITDTNPVGALSPTTWNSLSDQGIDAVDGPDPDNIVGNGIGETWDEAGGSNPNALAESFLFGSSTIAPTGQLTLGRAVTPNSTPSLGFEFRRADTGAILPGLIEFVTGGITGDFNNDGQWNCLDIDALSNAIATNSGDLSFDMNGDGVLSVADITDANVGWLAVGGTNNPTQTGGNPFLPGDANLSGAVDGSDFGVWNTNKFTNATGWCAGNFNASDAVDGSDFGVWNANKFRSSASAAVVPEPLVGWLWVMGWLVFCLRKRTAHDVSTCMVTSSDGFRSSKR